MKFQIEREVLLPALQRIVNIIEKRQNMPILSNVLMVVTGDQVCLTGTDLEIQIIAKLAMTGSGNDWATTVPARKFLDICRLLPSGALIKFNHVDDKITVQSGRSKFNLSCLPSENYPEFSESHYENHFSISAGQLKIALEKIHFCMANGDVRYYLNGALLQVSNNTLKLVASDGHRLAIFEDKIDGDSGCDAKIVLPRKGILELNRLLDATQTQLKAEFSSSNIRITLNNYTFSVKLIDAKYPEFGKVFMQEFKPELRVNRQKLKEVLARVAILTNEKIKGISIDVDDRNMKISAHNPENDEAEEELEIDYLGQPVSMGFNAQYFMDAVSNLDSEDAILNFADNSTACFIDVPGGANYRFVLMPMRL